MRYRFTGAMVAMAVAAAVSLTVMPLAGQAGRGAAPAGGAAPAPAGQGRGAAAPPQPAGRGAAAARPATHCRQAEFERRLAGARQRLLESRRSLGVRPQSVLAARRHRGDPGGSERVVEGGTIPYLPGGAEEAAGEHGRLAEDRSRGEVLHARHSARDLHALSVPDRSGTEGHPVRLRVRELEPHRPHGQPHRSRRWTAGWAGRTASGTATRS